MEVHSYVPLKNFTTMKLGGPARYLVEARTIQETIAAYHSASRQNIPVFILGGGSNVIARDVGYHGMVIRMRIPGFDILSNDVTSTVIRLGAGEPWDDVVRRSVEMNLTGIEAMAMIPGTCGAAPVQNVGAYGQEIADTFVSLDAYDTQTNQIVTLQHADCGFAYRHSIFRGEQTGRYIILSITLKLYKTQPTPPFYDALQTYFDDHHITLFTQKAVREAVIAIRADKLPDPAICPNAGSFFKNAIVENWLAADLQKTYPDVKLFDMGNGFTKVPTGWLIEKAGLKGKLLHGMRVHDKNALVLINESASGYDDLAQARSEIVDTVRDVFRIPIEQEPLEIS